MIKAFRKGVGRLFAGRKRAVGPLSSAREGGVAVTFALLSVGLLLGVAITIDISRLFAYRVRLNDAADAAALAAVNPGTFDVALDDAAQEAKSEGVGRAMFYARVPQDVTISALSVDVVRSGSTSTSTVTYSASFISTFGALLRPILEFSGTASSSYTAVHIDIHVLVDVSQSMGLGADAAVQSKMAVDPKVGYCAFACHGAGGSSDTVTAAHSAGYKLRIDVVKATLNKMIADAQATAAASRATIRIGLYTFDTKFKTVVPATSDFATLKTAATNLDIAVYGAGTSIQYGLSQLNAVIGTTGNGSTSAAPLTYVMVMTDGVANPTDNRSTGEWTYAATAYPAFSGKLCWPGQSPPPDAGPWYAPNGPPAATPCVPDPWTTRHVGNGQMELQPIDPSWCTPIKTKGATLMTLYTEYALVPAASTKTTDWTTNDWRLPLMQSQIIPVIPNRMVACASKSSDAHIAADAAGIDAALNKMFTKALSAATRVTR